MCCRRSCRWMTNLIVAPRIRRGVETLEVEEGTQLQAKTSSMIYLASVCVVVVKRRGVIAPDVRCVETRGTCKQSVVAQRAKSVAQLVASRGSRNFSSARQQQQRTQRKTGRVGRAASSPLSRTWNRWPPLSAVGRSSTSMSSRVPQAPNIRATHKTPPFDRPDLALETSK